MDRVLINKEFTMTKHADDSATQHEAMVRQNLLGRLIFCQSLVAITDLFGLDCGAGDLFI